MYTPTQLMIANLLTKPLQGAQFRSEARMLTNSDHLREEDRVSDRTEEANTYQQIDELKIRDRIDSDETE